MDVADLSTQIVAGAVAGDLAVSDIQLYDVLITVQALDISKNLVAEFTVTADGKINNAGGTNTNGQDVLVVWEKKYHYRSKFEESAGRRRGRSPF